MLARTKDYQSSSSTKTYTVGINTTEGNRIECNCQGWAVKKAGKARSCKHVVDYVTHFNILTVVSGDYLVATNTSARQAAIEHITKEKAKKASVLKPTTQVMGFNVIAVLDEHESAPEDAMTFYVKPMLSAHPNEEIDWSEFETGWSAEEKYDGHRVTLRVTDTHDVVAWSRPRASEVVGLSRNLPQHIVNIIKNVKFPSGTYDCELIVPGGTSTDVTKIENQPHLQLVIFDVLYREDFPLIDTPFERRREVLESAFEGVSLQNPNVRISEQFDATEESINSLWEAGKEGLILKKLDAVYQPGVRSPHSIKVKKENSICGVLIGYEDGKLGKNSIFRVRLPNKTVTTVKVKNNQMLADVQAKGDEFIGEKIRIKYQQLTPSGSPRHPRIDRWENIV